MKHRVLGCTAIALAVALLTIVLAVLASGGWWLSFRPVTVTVLDVAGHTPIEGAVVSARWHSVESPCIHGSCWGPEVRHAEAQTDSWGQVTFPSARVRRRGWTTVARDQPRVLAYKSGYVITNDMKDAISVTRPAWAPTMFLVRAKSQRESAGQIASLLENGGTEAWEWPLSEFPLLRQELTKGPLALPADEPGHKGPELVTPAPAKPMRIGGEVSAPVVIHSVSPVYEECSKEPLRGSGVLNLEAVIEADGTVASVRIMRPVHPCLDRVHVAALKQWRFRPATYRGRPVAVLFSMTVHHRRQ